MLVHPYSVYHIFGWSEKAQKACKNFSLISVRQGEKIPSWCNHNTTWYTHAHACMHPRTHTSHKVCLSTICIIQYPMKSIVQIGKNYLSKLFNHLCIVYWPISLKVCTSHLHTTFMSPIVYSVLITRLSSGHLLRDGSVAMGD